MDTKIDFSNDAKSYLTIASDGEQRSPTKEEPCSVGGVVISLLLSLILLPFVLLFSFFTVNPQEEVLILFWGKLNTICRKPGLNWYCFIGRQFRTISVKVATLDIKKTTVVDTNGNPIIVSGVVTYKVVDSIKAAFDVENVEGYLQKQALAILKQVCSRYPYESKDHHSLQREPEAVVKELVTALQQKAYLAGVKILSYELTDLQYAPEIAQGMLVRQQAQALLDARKTVVEGACGIVTGAVVRLGESGIKLSEHEQTRLVTNLLSVICAETKVQPTMSITEGYGGGSGGGNGNNGGGSEAQLEMLKVLLAIQANTRKQ